jgi:hypothetical protein
VSEVDWYLSSRIYNEAALECRPVFDDEDQYMQALGLSISILKILIARRQKLE